MTKTPDIVASPTRRRPTRRPQPLPAFTLVEVIAAAVVLAAIAAVSSSLLVSILNTRQAIAEQDQLDRMAAIAILRIEEHIRETSQIYIPNGHDLTRGILAIGYRFDDDGDGLFDEDATGAADAVHGVQGFDDDGDGSIDEGPIADDDEDGIADEDPLDGTDNDGDGLVDEDFPADMDGSGGNDDDNDGSTNEDPAPAIVYYLDGTNLMEWHPDLGTNVLARNVSDFRVTLEPAADSTGWPALAIEIDMQSNTGESRNYRIRAVPRNNGLIGN